MRFLFLIIFLSQTVSAYTLNNNFGAAFKNGNVKIRVASNTTCANAGMTIYELQDLIKPAMDNFWNRVSTSSLRLKLGSTTDPINNINTGSLCAPTDDDCITSSGGNVIPPVKDIVIACNSNSTNFSSGHVLAVTVPNSFSGRKITGAVILINDRPSNSFAHLSRSDKIGVISHEIGHAIGLGHSKDSAAMMYYRTVDHRRALGQDDADGVSYLYPVKLDGCGLLKGTIDTDGIDPQFWQLGISFLMMILLGKIMKLLLRRPITYKW